MINSSLFWLFLSLCKYCKLLYILYGSCLSLYWNKRSLLHALKIRESVFTGALYQAIQISALGAFLNPASLAAGRPINAWRYIFLQVTITSLPGWAVLPYDKYLHIYVLYYLFGSFKHCAALWHCARRTSKKSRWRHCLIQHVRIHDTICSNGLRSYLYRTKIAFRTDWSFAWHRVLGLKSCSD